MAYISQTTKKELSPKIKAVLKKYGMKGTISVRNHMVLVVKVQSGNLDIMTNHYNTVTENGLKLLDDYENPIEKRTELSANPFWLESNHSGKCLQFMRELFQACKIPEWADKTDIMTDYFDITYYIDINVGKWNKPYEFIA